MAMVTWPFITSLHISQSTDQHWITYRFLEFYAVRQEKQKNQSIAQRLKQKFQKQNHILQSKKKLKIKRSTDSVAMWIFSCCGDYGKNKPRRFRRNFGGMVCLSLSHTHTVWCVIDVAGEDDGLAWVIATAYCSLIRIETSRDWHFPWRLLAIVNRLWHSLFACYRNIEMDIDTWIVLILTSLYFMYLLEIIRALKLFTSSCKMSNLRSDLHYNWFFKYV